MKKMFVITMLALCMGILAVAQSKKDGPIEILGADFQQVTDGQGKITINSYGNTPAGTARTGFMIGTVGHVFQFTNFVSINNGAVEQVGGPGWSVVTGLAIADGTATSTVKKGDTLQIDYTQTVADNGDGLVDWLVSATFTNLTDRDMNLCYFPYLDYDLFGTEENDTATYSAVDDDLGVPVIRVKKAGRDEVFVFADSDGLSSDWRIGEWPMVIRGLQDATNCVALGSTGSPFGPGDFTAAFKFPLAITAGDSATVDLQMGRFQ